ncbi:MAG: 5'-methylthioadenosine/S-adenosylhomocysteine nucleosidase [Clostridiales bacterium]|nr:5'-methylthioadenosine/S-adenosylhomocysteine nucleosidase [Clostridiales bacterium]MCD7827411.1 5'-methylthioadenosine/S-adenosylhomocysteine nucleosidase [Clostridiales bacterium]
MKIGFVIADDNEYAPVLENAEKYGCKKVTRRNRESVEFNIEKHEIIAVKCGIGKVNAASAAAFLIADDNVDAIINFGLSGAVSGLLKGDIVAGTSFTECDFDISPLGLPVGVKPQDVYVYEADGAMVKAALSIAGVKSAKCGCGDFFLSDREKKDFYKETFGINEFDMETGAIASVCHDADIPFAAIRQISDDADDAASESYKEMNDKCEDSLIDVVIQIVKNL